MSALAVGVADLERLWMPIPTLVQGVGIRPRDVLYLRRRYRHVCLPTGKSVSYLKLFM
jgi:hypothetical protein